MERTLETRLSRRRLLRSAAIPVAGALMANLPPVHQANADDSLLAQGPNLDLEIFNQDVVNQMLLQRGSEAIERKYNELFGALRVGIPTSEATLGAGGTIYRTYENRSHVGPALVIDPKTGTVLKTLDEPNGIPGAIYWHESVGAFFVSGKIYKHFAALGAEGGFLGYPLSDHVNLDGGDGHFAQCAHFLGGSIYSHTLAGTHEVHGAIRDKWAALGWENGFLGFPISDESSTATPDGRCSHFRKYLPDHTTMDGSIYWTPTTGAVEVHGAIRDKWAELGWERSSFGYPIGDEREIPGTNGRKSTFQGGTLIWSLQTSAMPLPEKLGPYQPEHIRFGGGVPMDGAMTLTLFRNGNVRLVERQG